MTTDFNSRSATIQRRINQACNRWVGSRLDKDILNTIKYQVLDTLKELTNEKLIIPANYNVAVSIKHGGTYDVQITPEIQVITDFKNRCYRIHDFFNSEDNREIAFIVDNGKTIRFKIDENILETEDPAGWVYFERIAEYEKMVGSNLLDIRYPDMNIDDEPPKTYIRSYAGPIKDNDFELLSEDKVNIDFVPWYYEYGYRIITDNGPVLINAVSYRTKYAQDLIIIEGW